MGHLDFVTILGFVVTLLLTAISGVGVARWQREGSEGIEGWALGGRQFGTLVTWFLVGGDFYTAYTIIAVPAAVFATGAAGFFALPFTILVYPIVFVTMPRLWAVCRTHGLVTPSDFVRLRYGSHWLATAVALTGILALMPYIALQFLGIQAVLRQMGLEGSSAWSRILPIALAFASVALFTFIAGLRAPARIAFAKDLLIYIVVIAAVVILPRRFGGYHQMFALASVHFHKVKGASVILQPSGFSAYTSLALGSALAAFMYPHTMTSVLASASGRVIRKNAVLLPAYTFLLGLLALLGVVGAARGLHLRSSDDVVPALISLSFPRWFAGLSYAAITIAALVPAAIMAIAASNLFTRNIYLEYLHPDASPATQKIIARNTSLAINLCALVVVLWLPVRYAINLQLLGGVLVLQTLPAMVFGLWARLFHHGALLAGWAVSMTIAVLLLAKLKLQASAFPFVFHGRSVPIYVGLVALAVNLLVTAIGTLIADALRLRRHSDGTVPADYLG